MKVFLLIHTHEYSYNGRMKSVLYLFACLIIIPALLAQPTFASEFMLADPNIALTCIEYSGTPAAKIGDLFRWGNISIGGFLQSRNEERFHQGALPNHNWRGFAFLNYTYSLPAWGSFSPALIMGVEHESAHPSGGFYENNDEAYEMIYDGLYRNINMNSIRLSPMLSLFNGIAHLRLDYQLYLFSKNTPELHDTALAHGNGLSGGFDGIFPLSQDYAFFISAFFRYIFTSSARRSDWIYHNHNGTVVQIYEEYPVINSVHTISLKAGIIVPHIAQRRTLSLFARLLHGNPYGFIDSRENRFVIAVGVELMH